MRINRAKKGAIVREKLHGTYYIISAEEKDQDGVLISAEAAPIDMIKLREENPFMKEDDDETVLVKAENIPIVENDSVKIREANAICFLVIKDAKVSISGNWEVKDGILLHDGKAAVEQGNLEVERILKILESKILLLFKTEEESSVKLGIYDPSYEGREFCFPISYPISIPEITLLENGEILLSYTKFHLEKAEETKDVEDNKGEKEIEVFDDSGYIIFSPEGDLVDSQHCDEPLGHLVACTRNFYVFQGEFNGEPIASVIKRLQYDFTFWNLTVKSEVQSVTESDKGLFIKTEDSFVYIGMDGYEKEVSASKKLLSFFSDQLKGYDFVVEYKSSGRSDFVLTLATEDYKVHTLSGSNTRDLGLVLQLDK